MLQSHCAKQFGERSQKLEEAGWGLEQDSYDGKNSRYRNLRRIM